MADLGKKHECLSCGVKFYDLGKAVIVCPKCGANQAELSAAEAPAKPKAKAKKKAAAKTKKAASSKKKDVAKDGDEPDDKVSDDKD
jgi:uncharacterized protein (TIGR02300 family)